MPYPLARVIVLAVAACLCGTTLSAAAATPPTQEKIGKASDLLSLPPDLQPSTYRHIDQIFDTRAFARGAQVYPLPDAEHRLDKVSYAADGKTYGIDDFMSRNQVGGLLIIKDGRVKLERYGLGNDAHSLWTSFSVGKSIVSTLVGAAVKDGAIHSIDDPVTKYLPTLRGSAYDGVSLRNMLQMSSGVKWDEDYASGHSDIGRLVDCVSRKVPGCIVAFMSKLPRAAAPGTKFNYNTGETYLLGMVVSAATHKHLTQYLSEKIWSPFGMQSDGYWMLDSKDGQEMGGGSLSMTLRDYGRFGLFMLGGGIAGGAKVLPEGWIAAATGVHPDSPQVGYGKLDAGSVDGYGYQWWLFPPKNAGMAGQYSAEGVFGQFIYVNPSEKLVVVVWSAWPPAWVDSKEIETMAFFDATATALHKE